MIIGNDRFYFGIFTDSNVKTIDGDGSVDDPAYLLMVIKISRRLALVVSPGFDGIGVFAAPFVSRPLNGIIRHLTVDCSVDVL